MAAGGVSSRRKILLALDLDYTHFDSTKALPTWLGSKEFWINLYREVVKIAASRDVDVVFAITTSKDKIDDICIEAATVLGEFITRHCPHQYKIDHLKGYWVLVNLDGKLQFECLYKIETRHDSIAETAFSHFHIKFHEDKSPLILDVAEIHNIPAHDCILLDDSPKTLQLARENKIQTVSFEVFNINTINPDLFDDPEFVMNELQLRRLWLINKVNQVLGIEDILTPSVTYVPKFKQEETSDPERDEELNVLFSQSLSFCCK